MVRLAKEILPNLPTRIRTSKGFAVLDIHDRTARYLCRGEIIASFTEETTAQSCTALLKWLKQYRMKRFEELYLSSPKPKKK